MTVGKFTATDMVELQTALAVVTEERNQLAAELTELKRFHLQFRGLLENLPAAAYTCDEQGLITYFNQQAVKIWGRTPELNDSVDHFYDSFKLFNAAGEPICRDQGRMALAMRTGQEYRGEEIVIERPDGVRLVVLAHASPIFDETKKLLGAVNILVDITQRKRAQEAEAFLAAIVASSADAIYSRTVGGLVLTWNIGAERLYGFTAAEAIGASMRLIIPPENYEKEQEVIQRICQGQAVAPYETVRLTKDGKRIDIFVAASAIRDEAGNIMGISKVSRDITAQKKASQALRDSEQALRESENRFYNMANNAPVLIWVNGLKGCEFVNREYLRFLGCTFDDVRRMKWEGFLHPDDAPAYLAAYHTALENQKRFEAQTRFRQADGSYRWIHSTGAPRFTKTGVFLGYVGCSVDITEMKQTAEALQEADRRKDEFLALLAHELRNPLAPLQNGLHILNSIGVVNPVAVKTREMMERQLHHLVRLIDDLLDMNRITRNKLELRLQPIALEAIVQSAVETVRPLIDAAQQDLQIALPSEPVHLQGDLTRLAQVLSNLLSNSAKYTPAGGRIWLTAERMQDIVVITVRDTGIGIPADSLPRIFDMFAQAERTRERTQGGLGIGLSLVRRLTEMHGGTVEAHSAGPGQGSAFVVRLPILTKDLAGTKDTKTRHAIAPAPRGPSRRFLVVDDNRDAAISLASLFQMDGNEVRLAFDGMEAVETAEAFRPDVILLDLGMPKLNGLEVARRVRQRSWSRNVTIVAVTGWGQEQDRRRTREAGFDHHLVKPVDYELLQGLLKNAEA